MLGRITSKWLRTRWAEIKRGWSNIGLVISIFNFLALLGLTYSRIPILNQLNYWTFLLLLFVLGVPIFIVFSHHEFKTQYVREIEIATENNPYMMNIVRQTQENNENIKTIMRLLHVGEKP